MHQNIDNNISTGIAIVQQPPMDENTTLCKKCGKDHGPGRCRAHSKRDNMQPCKKLALANGLGLCRLHGGLSPRAGPGHPTFVHGRRSKVMSGDLKKDYLAALKDPELLSLSSDIAIVDARQIDVLRTLRDGEVGLREQLSVAWKEMIAARGREDNDKALALLDSIGRLISEGTKITDAWREWDQLAEKKRKLAASEHKRMADMQYLVTAERAQTLIMGIMAIMTRHVQSPEIRSAISEDIAQLEHIARKNELKQVGPR